MGGVAGATDEGERVETRQAVATARRVSPAHGRHVAVVLWRWSGRGARERRGAARRQALRARWAGPDMGRASGGRGGRPSQLRPWAEKRGGGP